MATPPETTVELLEAIQSRLAALTWPATIDAATPIVFRSVVIAGAFPGIDPFDLVRNLPAALIVDGGQRYVPERREFADTTLRIGVLHRLAAGHPSGENGITNTKGLHALVLQVRKSLFAANDLSDSLYLANQSGTALLAQAGDPGGQTWIAKELQFVVRHQDVVPA